PAALPSSPTRRSSGLTDCRIPYQIFNPALSSVAGIGAGRVDARQVVTGTLAVLKDQRVAAAEHTGLLVRRVQPHAVRQCVDALADRKSTRLNSSHEWT